MYKSDIETLAKECGIKDDDMSIFLEFFENESEWIGVLCETFLDRQARQVEL